MINKNETIKQKTILAVASGMHEQKNVVLERYEDTMSSAQLNSAMLGLSTLLHEKGYSDVKMFQGGLKSPQKILDEIRKKDIDIRIIEHPVLLSIPSFYAIDWANDFCKDIKDINPDVKIVVGGRWVIDANKNWIKQKMPNVNFFVQGCADNVIEQVLDQCEWQNLSKPQTCRKPFAHFNYKLLHDFKRFQPHIDFSRGCPKKCHFCPERFQPYGLSSTKTPKDIIREVQDISVQYNDNNLNFYVESAHFSPTEKWSNEFAELYAKNNMQFKWRVQGRVDEINPNSAKILSSAGLKMFYLGLESASPTQLLRMQKTNNPKDYLEKAQKLLRVCFDSDVWAQLNILLYPGETNETIKETESWLSNNPFKGIRVSPFVLYRNGVQMDSFVQHITQLSSIVPDMKELESKGFTLPDLSNEISKEEAKKIANAVASRHMSYQDYLDLKNICLVERCY